jgi:hypothetical protein
MGGSCTETTSRRRWEAENEEEECAVGTVIVEPARVTFVVSRAKTASNVFVAREALRRDGNGLIGD